MSTVIDARAQFAAEFERLARTGPAWLRTRRAEAMERFTGFPTPDLESWRFTDTGPIAERSWTPGRAAAAPKGLAEGPLKGCQIVFVNGQHDAAHSHLPVGTEVRAGLDEHAPIAESTPFAALNRALAVDGAVVRVQGTVDAPIHVLHVATGAGTANFPRTLIVAAPGSRASVVESFVGAGATFTDAVTEIEIGENASIDYHRLQREHTEACHVHALAVRQARNSRFVSHSIALGAAISRSEVEATLEGEGAEVTAAPARSSTAGSS
jgi:Fe-S cluster assembly protein SufD